ncbi:dimethylaniline monooxygenase [N-oxide-forming] 3-like [Contarinia nasturtii]|uniref:dimethylaniline monooxygenase [N-oxide-forming] 3-like n=1 Tax=Contarinia nasturtii TaxID=265458 RepID=UPI0012D44781|nr:dimethylaniline monooxygenase [N-oxide-forming] 3-like [Contarinia nasturtii]
MTLIPFAKCVLLVFIFGFLSGCSALNIAVIGAGPSGIVSAKNAIDQKHNVTIFEKTGTLGGVWYYTEETGTDEYGVEIHTAMYRDLRTNLPKQLMEFPNYSYPNDTRSFPSHDVILKYLNSYAEKFHVKERIRFHHLVDKVSFNKSGKWHVTVLRKNLPKTKQTETHEFDAVFVCSGINFEKRIPKINGAKKFKGTTLHSRDYRTPEAFIGKDVVLVIGQGPSGYDIAWQLDNIGVQVIHSSYQPMSSAQKIVGMAAKLCSKACLNEYQTPDCRSDSEYSNVSHFKGENQVVFHDGSHENISVVIYATGYKFSYPFLDKSVGIHVKDNYVEPLYLHVLNIQHPTMAFIGLAHGGVHFRMYDLQARFALKFVSGAEPLPSKKEMQQFSHAISYNKKPHSLGSQRKGYYFGLAVMADIENIPDIYPDIYADIVDSDGDFREYIYNIHGDQFDKVREP